MPSITVTMPYIADLTANHAYINTRHGRVLKPVVKTWRQALACEIRAMSLDLTSPLSIRIDWQGPMEPDQDNRCKIVWDAIQMAAGINDRHFIAVPGGYERVNAREANITITIEWEG
jgi:hypothetical protein